MPALTDWNVSPPEAAFTVTDAVPLADPDVAVTVAVPFAPAVTRPVVETPATDGEEEVQVTTALLIVTPFWSRTVATSCCVSPSDEKVNVEGESVTVVATGVLTVTDAVPAAKPEVAVTVDVPSATAVTRPVDETLATEVLEDDHETEAPAIAAPF